VIQDGRAAPRRNGKPSDGIGVIFVRIELCFDTHVIGLKNVAQFFRVPDGDDVVGGAVHEQCRRRLRRHETHGLPLRLGVGAGENRVQDLRVRRQRIRT
jgi:hypothetical protein